MEFQGTIEVETIYLPYEEAQIGEYAYINIIYAVPVIEEYKTYGNNQRASNLLNTIDQSSYYYWVVDDSLQEGIIYVPSNNVSKFESLMEETDGSVYVSGKKIDALSSIKKANTDGDINKLLEVYQQNSSITVDLNQPKTHEEPSGIGKSTWALLVAAVAVILGLIADKKAKNSR